MKFDMKKEFLDQGEINFPMTSVIIFSIHKILLSSRVKTEAKKKEDIKHV